MPVIAPVVVFALIVGIVLAFAAMRRANREERAGKGSAKKSLESTKLVLEIGAIGAGAIWLLNTFYSSELDVHRGRSVSVPIKVDAA